MPKISIIVPIYNTEEYLDRCLDSLVNQSMNDIEIILINDGSSDNSEEIVKKYQNIYGNKIIYHKKKNEGQAVARNMAIKMACGEYLMFVDSDDWISLDACSKLYNASDNGKIDIVCGDYYKVILDKIMNNDDNKYENEDERRRYLLRESGPCLKIIKRKLITDNNLFFPELRAYEDIGIVPLWGIYANRIAYIKEPIYYYLIHDGSTMKQTKYNDKLTHIYPSLDNLYHKFKLINKPEFNEEIEYIYVEHLLHAAALRFYQFDKYDEIKKINKIMKERFPNWRKNKYYQNKLIKYKIVCNLIYREKFNLLKLVLKKK